MRKSPKLIVAGGGPGNPDYILPVVLEKIREAEVIGVSERFRESLPSLLEDKELVQIGAGVPLRETVTRLKTSAEEGRNTLLLVSGDTGFYSMLGFIRRELPDFEIEVYPGINSLQYLLSRIGEGYEETELISLHGRDCNLKEKLKTGRKLGILTDKEKSLQYVLSALEELGQDREVILGERLSYPDERITRQQLDSVYEPDELSVILVK